MPQKRHQKAKTRSKIRFGSTEMKERKKKVYDDDDGRVISPMDVDGMPWYEQRCIKTEKEEEEVDFRNMTPDEKKEYRKQTRIIIIGVLRYLIPMLLLFAAVFTAIILMMVFLW